MMAVTHLPWQEPYTYVEVSEMIIFLENHLECIKQEGETTEAEIQKLQEYANYLQQNYNEYVEQYKKEVLEESETGLEESETEDFKNYQFADVQVM